MPCNLVTLTLPQPACLLPALLKPTSLRVELFRRLKKAQRNEAVQNPGRARRGAAARDRAWTAMPQHSAVDIWRIAFKRSQRRSV